MSATNFWPTAWAVEESLNQSAPPVQAELEALIDSLLLQRLIFVHHDWHKPGWLDELKSAGLFRSPPEVIQTPNGLQAQAWPALAYLGRAASEQPRTAEGILVDIESDNWWVVTDALGVAVTLPDEIATTPILHLLRSYQRAPVQWAPPELLASVLSKLAASPDGPWDLTEGAYRILGKLLDDSNRAYTIPEVIHVGTAEMGERALPAVANGIEAALIATTLRSGTRFSAFDNLDTVLSNSDSLIMDEGVSHLIRAWVSIVEREIETHGPGRGALRATSLLAIDSTMLRQMGIRVLRIASEQTEGPDPDIAASLNWLITSNLWLEGSLQAETLPLIGPIWSKLDSSVTRDALRRLSDEGDDGQLSPYVRRNWLAALSSHLGPDGEELLNRLVEEYGPPRSEFVLGQPRFEWVGPESPIPPDQIGAMEWPDLLPFVSHTPGGRPTESMWGASPEGLGRLLRGKVSRDAEGVVPHLRNLVESARYPTLLYSLVEGLTEGFKETPPSPSFVGEIQDFLLATITKARSGDLLIDPDWPNELSAVTGAVADFLEQGSDWVVALFDPVVTLSLLRDIAADPEPSLSGQADPDTDPVIVGLNTARGKALRASLRLLIGAQSVNGSESSNLISGISEIVSAAAGVEWSPGVRSSFGVFLPQLIKGLPQLWREIEPLVLPRATEAARLWASAWGSYVAFHPAYRDIAGDLQIHYEMSVERRSHDGCEYLNEVFSRLINHLIALSLSGTGEEWRDLTLRALAASQDEQAAQSFNGLLGALTGQSPRFELMDVVQLVQTRTDEIRSRRSPRVAELTALLGVVMATGVSLESTGGLLLDLLQLGAIPEPETIVDFLRNSDPNHSFAGAKILREAAAAGSFTIWFSDVEGARDLIRAYGERHQGVMWETVNLLGSQGLFWIETEARDLIPDGPTSSS